jgi:hypothetical protein
MRTGVCENREMSHVALDQILRRVRVETDALKGNKDLASTRTPLSLVRDEGVAGTNPATPTNT